MHRREFLSLPLVGWLAAKCGFGQSKPVKPQGGELGLVWWSDDTIGKPESMAELIENWQEVFANYENKEATIYLSKRQLEQLNELDVIT